jgi:hypothetical protein
MHVMNNPMNDFVMRGLEGLYCIRHRKNPQVFINDEGFITTSTCCDEFHEALYHAQDDLRYQYSLSEMRDETSA